MNDASSNFTGICTALFVFALICAGSGALILYARQWVRQMGKPQEKWYERNLAENEEPTCSGEYPLNHEFWSWYNALLAQDDFSYDEARCLYKLYQRREKLIETVKEIGQ